jgi:saccharopine dehydrogenase-like NADP-dependent oxidoreductase
MATVAVIGAGAVGRRVARHLAAVPEVERLILGARHPQRLRALGRQLLDVDVEVVAPGPLPQADVVVLTLPAGGHVTVAEEALGRGAHVVSTSDAVSDVEALLELDAAAAKAERSVIVGAGFSPGLSCLLARHVGSLFDEVHEVHVARAGSGGPACQRQLHRARTGFAVDFRDGAWRRRPGGSGRELVWFPDPLGARDCYRAALPDALLLVPAFPDVQRVTARVAATRRDRLTAILPMLRPPHAEGGPGATRVEVRGQRGSTQRTEIAGVIDHPSAAAGAVAAVAAEWSLADDLPTGAWGLGMLDEPLPWLTELARRGVRAATFEGISTP